MACTTHKPNNQEREPLTSGMHHRFKPPESRAGTTHKWYAPQILAPRIKSGNHSQVVCTADFSPQNQEREPLTSGMHRRYKPPDSRAGTTHKWYAPHVRERR